MEDGTKKVKIGMWKNSRNNLNSSVKGLTKEQLDMIQKLRVGDRITLFSNDYAGDKEGSPQFFLVGTQIDSRNEF